jgi:hypothetical protein
MALRSVRCRIIQPPCLHRRSRARYTPACHASQPSQPQASIQPASRTGAARVRSTHPGQRRLSNRPAATPNPIGWQLKVNHPAQRRQTLMCRLRLQSPPTRTSDAERISPPGVGGKPECRSNRPRLFGRDHCRAAACRTAASWWLLVITIIRRGEDRLPSFFRAWLSAARPPHRRRASPRAGRGASTTCSFAGATAAPRPVATTVTLNSSSVRDRSPSRRRPSLLPRRTPRWCRPPRRTHPVTGRDRR